MRVKWTSIPKVLKGNAAVPWSGRPAADTPKDEAKKEVASEREPNRRNKTKADRALGWLRRGGKE